MMVLRSIVAILALALCGCVASLVLSTAPAIAQEQAAEGRGEVDYPAWEKDAATAEEIIDAGRASTDAMESLRTRMVDWRTQFDAARNTNAAQIETLRTQIAALGAPPADGATEAPETAQRRRELTEILSRQQAPSIAAIEAFSRAEGLIRQIDALIRERQADALLRLQPSPANPLHWPAGVAVLHQGLKTLSSEIRAAWDNPIRRTELNNNLPGVVVCFALAILLLWRAPIFLERVSLRYQGRTTARARVLVLGVVSIGQIVVPVLGMVLFVAGVMISGMTGPRLESLISALPNAALSFYCARWLGHWLFPDVHQFDRLRLTDRPAEARFHVGMIGLVVALELFRIAFTTEVRPPLSQAAQAVWLAPNVLIVSIFAFRLGMLLRRSNERAIATNRDAQVFRDRMVSLGGTMLAIAAVAAPVLALVGYVTAANALIWPAIGTVALVGLLLIVQRLVAEIYVVVTQSGDEGREALVPVLSGFLLAMASLPLLALIWGARPAVLSEMWTRFNQGLTLGETQISPTAVLTFLVVFAIGYMVTRLLQGAMQASVLPRTRLDKGAQNAAVSGIGYVGIFLSGLAAVHAAGINLSSLAIVAGALSVGIGFGLQNIVQNFIAGIILLVERPIGEGDLIEVGDKIGTVRSISVRSTRILTGDQTEVIVPNAQFVSGIVTNWTRESLRSRAIIPVIVAEGSDTRLVESLLMSIIQDQPLVLIDPPPGVFLTGFGPNGINFEIRAILSDLNLKSVVVSEVNHTIVERFGAEGIELVVGRQDPRAQAPEAKAQRRQRAPARAKPSKAVAAPARAINNDPSSDPDEHVAERR